MSWTSSLAFRAPTRDVPYRAFLPVVRLDEVPLAIGSLRGATFLAIGFLATAVVPAAAFLRGATFLAIGRLTTGVLPAAAFAPEVVGRVRAGRVRRRLSGIRRVVGRAGATTWSGRVRERRVASPSTLSTSTHRNRTSCRQPAHRVYADHPRARNPVGKTRTLRGHAWTAVCGEVPDRTPFVRHSVRHGRFSGAREALPEASESASDLGFFDGGGGPSCALTATLVLAG